MQSLLFSIATGGYDDLFSKCLQTHAAYARRIGFEHRIVNKQPWKLKPEEAAWLKILLLKENLSTLRPWVLFIDADCEIRAHAPSPETLPKDAPIFMANGKSGRLNSGVIFCRPSAKAASFFEEVLRSADRPVEHEEDEAPYENGHVIQQAKRQPCVGLLEHNLWNNNSSLDQESYIQHYSGGALRKYYLENCAPFKWKFQGRLKSFWVGRNNDRPSDNLPISERLELMLPFYKDNYPSLISSRTCD